MEWVYLRFNRRKSSTAMPMRIGQPGLRDLQNTKFPMGRVAIRGTGLAADASSTARDRLDLRGLAEDHLEGKHQQKYTKRLLQAGV